MLRSTPSDSVAMPLLLEDVIRESLQSAMLRSAVRTIPCPLLAAPRGCERQRPRLPSACSARAVACARWRSTTASCMAPDLLHQISDIDGALCAGADEPLVCHERRIAISNLQHRSCRASASAAVCSAGTTSAPARRMRSQAGHGMACCTHCAEVRCPTPAAALGAAAVQLEQAGRPRGHRRQGQNGLGTSRCAWTGRESSNTQVREGT